MLLHAEILGKMLASPGITVESIHLSTQPIFANRIIGFSLLWSHFCRLTWAVPSLASKKGDHVM